MKRRINSFAWHVTAMALTALLFVLLGISAVFEPARAQVLLLVVGAQAEDSEDHPQGASGIPVVGSNLGDTAGTLHMFQNEDRSGAADTLTVGFWANTYLNNVGIPLSTNNTPGAVFLVARHSDMTWSNSYPFTLSIAGAVGIGGRPNRRRGRR